MQFLSPWTILLAAGLTAPPLIALYFLKLKRREVPISSTFFWKRAVQDLQVNAPFQKLRRNLLLLLQLFVIALAAAALGEPLLRQEEKLRRSLIVLIDRSASMNVREPDGRTRLQRAQREAVKLVEQMRAGTRRDAEDVERIMVIAFSDRAQIVEPFSNNRGELIRAIESIQPTDGLSRLQEALALAEAHAQVQVIVSEDSDDTTSSTVAASTVSKVVLFSDGRIEDAGEVTLQAMPIELVNVAVADDNVGIVSLSASRNYQRPEVLSAVARVQNFGPAAVELDVELYVGGRHADVQSVVIGIEASGDGTAQADPQDSVAVVVFDDVVFDGSGVLEARLLRRDVLAADNRALAVISPPRSLSALLVSSGNLWLDRALRALPIELTRMAPEEYEEAAQEQLTEGGRSRFDTVIFDDCSSARLPKGNYLFFGQVPAVEGFALGQAGEFDTVFDWNETHPVMRYVEPSNVEYWSWRALLLPDSAVPLMRGGGGVVVAAINHAGNRYVVTAFPLLDETRSASNSTWHLRPHFVVFLTNALQYLSGHLGASIEPRMRPGDPYEIEVADGVNKVPVKRPDGQTHTVLTGGLPRAHYAKTDRVGLYEVGSPDGDGEQFVVNLFSEVESRVRPNNQLVIGGEAVDATRSLQMINLPVWPWLLVGVLAFLMLEWVVYSKRVLV